MTEFSGDVTVEDVLGALAPLAAMADAFDPPARPPMGSGGDAVIYTYNRPEGSYTITIGHLRRARAVYRALRRAS